MTPPDAEELNDHQVAADLATRAGAILLEVRQRLSNAGAEPQELKDTGDREAHEFLMAELTRLRPADAVLSEEGKDDLARLDAERTWIVDPLDGTREFGEPPRVDWAVHVALVVAGAPILGAVALPAQGVTLHTGDAPALPPPHQGPVRVISSRTRPGVAAAAVVEALDGEMVHMGSAGAKAMAVVQGDCEIYAHTGGQYEWDSAAPVAVALAAGLHASRIDGSPLVYNNENPYLPDLLICRKEFAAASLAALEGVE